MTLAAKEDVGTSYFGSTECGDVTLRPEEIADDNGASPSRARHSTHNGGCERYVIEQQIARGGQADILLAQDLKLRRPVAIKQLRRRGKAAEIRFVNEALITARLAHPSIVPIYDVGHWADGTPYFAMKLVRGDTLADRLRTLRHDVEGRRELVHIVLRVIDAVAYAHRERVIHRDLKPSNILVSDFGQTVVIDWGIAKLLDENTGQVPVLAGIALGAPRGVLGTPGFMAPEQAAGGQVDGRTDIYALGALLYLILAGRTPFSGLSATEIVECIRRGEPVPSLAELAPDVASAISRVVDQAMATDPDDRFADADELGAALRDALPAPPLLRVG